MISLEFVDGSAGRPLEDGLTMVTNIQKIDSHAAAKKMCLCLSIFVFILTFLLDFVEFKYVVYFLF